MMMPQLAPGASDAPHGLMVLVPITKSFAALPAIAMLLTAKIALLLAFRKVTVREARLVPTV